MTWLLVHHPQLGTLVPALASNKPNNIVMVGEVPYVRLARKGQPSRMKGNSPKSASPNLRVKVNSPKSASPKKSVKGPIKVRKSTSPKSSLKARIKSGVKSVLGKSQKYERM